MAIRAFLAVSLPPETVRAVCRLQQRLKPDLPNVRWVRPASLHLTLRFFPEISEETLEKITQIMLSVECLFPSVFIRISGLGAFPGPSRARVFWLGVKGDPTLYRLYQFFDEQFAQIGLPGENRPFTPHLTLGRHRQGLAIPRTILQQYEKIDCGTFITDRVTLFQSRLDPAGAIHTPIRTAKFKGPPSAELSHRP